MQLFAPTQPIPTIQSARLYQGHQIYTYVSFVLKYQLYHRVETYKNHKSLMVKSPHKCSIGYLRKETQAIPLPPFFILRLAQGVKVQQGFHYRSLRPAEILVGSKECQNPQIFLPPIPLSKTCYRCIVNSKLFKHRPI